MKEAVIMMISQDLHVTYRSLCAIQQFWVISWGWSAVAILLCYHEMWTFPYNMLSITKSPLKKWRSHYKPYFQLLDSHHKILIREPDMKRKMSSPPEPQFLRSHGESHREPTSFGGNLRGEKISRLVDGGLSLAKTPLELPRANKSYNS